MLWNVQEKRVSSNQIVIQIGNMYICRLKYIMWFKENYTVINSKTKSGDEKQIKKRIKSRDYDMNFYVFDAQKIIFNSCFC